MKFGKSIVALSFGVLAAGANAGLVDLRQDANGSTTSFTNDGLIGANEYGAGNVQNYQGVGTGFGGVLGGNGRMYMDFDTNNLFVGFKAGNNLNDLVVMFLDTRAGGFTDAQMNDNADGGRRVTSNITLNDDDQWDPDFLPDYSVVIASWGIVTFELNAGNTDGHLIFKEFFGSSAGNDPNVAREVALSKATYNIGTGFNWMAYYISDSNYASDETMPGQSWSGSGNPGFGNGGVRQALGYNRFEVVPEPGTMAAIGLGLAGLLARRRRKA